MKKEIMSFNKSLCDAFTDHLYYFLPLSLIYSTEDAADSISDYIDISYFHYMEEAAKEKGFYSPSAWLLSDEFKAQSESCASSNKVNLFNWSDAYDKHPDAINVLSILFSEKNFVDKFYPSSLSASYEKLLVCEPSKNMRAFSLLDSQGEVGASLNIKIKAYNLRLLKIQAKEVEQFISKDPAFIIYKYLGCEADGRVKDSEDLEPKIDQRFHA